MLAQFQSKYPQGSLITELVQIHHGKYIVRASVQIDGVTRATGMAAAEQLEEAEDKARSRALMVLGINSTTQAAVAIAPEPPKPVQPTPIASTQGLNESPYSTAINSLPTEVTAPPPVVPPLTAKTETKTQNVSEHIPAPSKQEFSAPQAATTKQESLFETKIPDTNDRLPTSKPEVQFATKTPDINDRFAVTDNQEAQFNSQLENLGIVSPTPDENKTLPGLTPNNVTPFPSRGSTSVQDTGNQTAAVGKKKKKSEPVDSSDNIAVMDKIDAEMKRLGWTMEDGRDYLKKTYGKLSRRLLNEEQLIDFLNYLESQPSSDISDIDPLAGF